MTRPLLICLAALAGALLPLQAATNARLGAHAPSLFHAALINFIVGAIALAAVALLAPTRAGVTWSSCADAPWWSWLGGLMGAAFVAAAIRTTPQLGTALMLCAAIAGQMVASLAIDHYGLVGMARRPISLERFAGIGLVFAGVLVMLRSK